jgi:predicted porin
MTDGSGAPRYVAYTLDRLSERFSLAGLDGVLASDSGSARQSYVGIASRFGALSLRRLMHFEHPPEHAVFPGPAYRFDSGADHAPAYTQVRHDITYVTPALHGLKAAAMVSVGESTHSNEVNRIYGATLGYARGPITLSISRQKKNNLIEATGTTPAVDNSARNTMFAANVGLGIATAYSAYSQRKGSSSVRWSDASPYGMLLAPTQSNNSRDVLLGFAIPIESVTLMASHIRHDDRSAANLDATGFAIGMLYTLSKRTDMFAMYAQIQSRAATGSVLDPVSSPGGAAFNIGLRHSF